MARYKVFFCEPTSRHDYDLRIYETVHGAPCPETGSYHNAHSPLIGTLEVPPGKSRDPLSVEAFADDQRWPTHCGCGHVFSAMANRQVWMEQVYTRSDNGEDVKLRSAPPGAVWNAEWMAGRDGFTGPDGRCLICKCPDGHDWMIDGRASNCTMPDDDVHKCWVRHGRPEDGTLHVDKNGNTCAAGAGSIATPRFHGFLHHGELYDC
jgi:hypothetical protein